MPDYLCTMLKQSVHQIKMTLVCSHMQWRLQPFDSNSNKNSVVVTDIGEDTVFQQENSNRPVNKNQTLYYYAHIQSEQH